MPITGGQMLATSLKNQTRTLPLYAGDAIHPVLQKGEVWFLRLASYYIHVFVICIVMSQGESLKGTLNIMQ